MKRRVIAALTILLALQPIVSDAKMSDDAYKMFQNANALEKQNKYLEAVDQLKSALELSPDEAILYIKLGGMYSEIGDWNNALVAYKKAIKLKPNDAVVYISIGNILQQQNDYDNAFMAYSQALTIFPEYKYNYLNLANVKALQGDNIEAIQYFKTFLGYYPDNTEARENLASIYMRLDKYQDAADEYAVLYTKNPATFKEYSNYGLAMLKSGDYPNAAEMLKCAIKEDPNDYTAHGNLAIAYVKLQKEELALIEFRKAFEIKPDLHSLKFDYANLLADMGKTQDAIENYNEYLTYYPKDEMAYFNLGSAYQIKQEHQKAVEYLQKAVELEEDESFLAALAMSEVKLKKYEDALRHYKQLALMCPGKENYKYNLITCYEALGDIQTAISMLENLVYVNPKFVLPAQKLASLYIQTNQLNKAKEIYDNILLKNKLTTEVMHQYAILSSSLCDTDTAEKMLKKVIQMNPDIPKAHKDLAIIYLNKRLFDYAEDEFKTALKLAPNDFEIIFEYGNF